MKRRMPPRPSTLILLSCSLCALFLGACSDDDPAGPKVEPIDRIEVTPTMVRLYRAGETSQMTAVAYDRNDQVMDISEFEWRVTDANVVTAQNGVLTARCAGLVSVMASARGVTGRADAASLLPCFSGMFTLDAWSRTGIAGGTTRMTPETGVAESVEVGYDVDLEPTLSGVSYRTAKFQIGPAPVDGTVTFLWTYSGYHAWHQTQALLLVYAGDTQVVAYNGSPGGNFEFSGQTTIEVKVGQNFGVEIGGKNYDSDARIRGTLRISHLIWDTRLPVEERVE